MDINIKDTQLRHKEAMEFFRQKLLIPSEQWDDLIGPIHAKAFTVAGAVKHQLLQDFYESVSDAISNGKTLGEFRKDFDAIVKKHGWSYKGERGWRSRVIFQVNKRSAYMAGQWKQFQRNKKLRPYLVYMTVDDARVREAHQRWHRIALHIDDPFWRTHFPPNDWLCRCYVISASKRDLKRMGLTVGNVDSLEPIDVIDPRTGEVFKTPPGIGVGWDYNVGQAWLSPEVLLGQQLMEAPAKLRQAALDWAKSDVFDKPFETMAGRVAYQMATGGEPVIGEAQTAGFLNNAVVEHLIAKGQTPIGVAITVQDRNIAHWLRDAKASNKKDIAISISTAKFFPRLLRNPDAILYDQQDPALLYIKRLADGRFAKFVVRINLRGKLNHNKRRFKEHLNTVNSAGVVSRSDLNQPRYETITGSL